MSSWDKAEMIDSFYEAILKLNDKKECDAFFLDVCTAKEICEISQRLEVAKLLRAGANYNTICKETGASTATISRVSKCLENGQGYKLILNRIYDDRDENME